MGETMYKCVRCGRLGNNTGQLNDLFFYLCDEHFHYFHSLLFEYHPSRATFSPGGCKIDETLRDKPRGKLNDDNR